MKTKILLTALLVIISISLFSQTRMITLSGGYAFANIDADFTFQTTKTEADGWRVNAVYEYIAEGQNVALGILVGYATIKASETNFGQTVEDELYTVPIVFAPKLLFGKGKFKGFVKVDIGMQFSGINQTGGGVNMEADALGFLAGVGGGVMLDLGEKWFINAEYELDWMTNGYYDGGWLNSPLLGIGMKF